MRPAARQTRQPRVPDDLPLHNGDNLTQAEFHRLYETCPKHVKAELIGGIVYMASPLRRPHSTYHMKLGGVLCLYEEATEGTEALDNATTILAADSEPQPDLALRILPEYGGQSDTDEDEYIVRAPEFVAEIAHSSRALDMNQKRIDYQRAGVQEYLVVLVKDRELHWFQFQPKRKLAADSDGVYRSRVFPGLWVDGKALLARNLRRLLETARAGLASRAHAEFVRRLQKAHRDEGRE